MKTEETIPASADEKSLDEQQPIVTEGTIKYRLSIFNNAYEFENENSVMSDLAGLLICKRVHSTMIDEIIQTKKDGIQPQFKAALNQRHKDLVKSLHTIDKSIKHLFKYSAKTILENQVKEEKVEE